jgi:hypothetical protein
MFTGLDVTGGKSHDLTVFIDTITDFYIGGSDFVTENNVFDAGDVFFSNYGAGRDVATGDDDVVGIVQTDDKRFSI